MTLPQRPTYHLEQKHVFFNNSSLQKIQISSHPEHVFFHKGSHILSPKHAILQRLFHSKFTYLPTQTPSFKDPSTEYSLIISHKACLFKKIHSSSHPKHVFFLHAFFHKEPHILSPTPCHFSMALPHKIQFTYLPTQTMPSFKGSSTDNSHIFPHKPCLVSLKDSSTENSHILSPNTCLSTCLLSMNQRQHMCKSCQGNGTLCRIKPGNGWDSLCYIHGGFTQCLLSFAVLYESL